MASRGPQNSSVVVSTLRTQLVPAAGGGGREGAEGGGGQHSGERGAHATGAA